MPTVAKTKTVAGRLTQFRFSHRGAEDFSQLMQVYREKFHLAQPVVVRLTGFSPRSVAKWAQGETPSQKQEKALVEMDRLLDGLARVMDAKEIGRWMNTANAAFDGSTPAQVVERGETDRIWRMLYDVESGQPG
jgi:hypothetical protein